MMHERHWLAGRSIFYSKLVLELQVGVSLAFVIHESANPHIG
jgi:hypothetical protein